ncbi:hypothetical protein GCM10027262_50660 [Nocardia tengchongensis]
MVRGLNATGGVVDMTTTRWCVSRGVHVGRQVADLSEQTELVLQSADFGDPAVLDTPQYGRLRTG